MRVDVTLDRCDSHGTCVDLCPEVFDLTDDDDIVLLNDHPAEALRAKVERAARSCPKNAITVSG